MADCRECRETEPAPEEVASPCRLAVFLASEARSAVVLRRGPKAWAQLVAWDRTNDVFSPGQWFRGRVHERRCDLSPDGRLFVYFACKHGPRRDDEKIGECWTAISRPPYFTALALWTNLGAWYGGGFFETSRDLVLDASCGLEAHSEHQPDRRLRLSAMSGDTSPWACRKLRDGWERSERGFHPRTHRRVGAHEVWEKLQPGGTAKLCCEVEDVDFARYGGPYAETHWLEQANELIPLPGVEWADWDGPARLVFVRAGKLLSAVLEGAQLREQLLFDFNPLEPERIAPPDWARRW